MDGCSPFTAAVTTVMRRLYPECLADRSFDNTGLLLQAPFRKDQARQSNSVLLTIDLTRAVADEAIEGKHSVVIAYHPIIFRGLKSITLENSQQNSLLRLASHGISVYSPHTAVDTVPDGMADWLGDIVTGQAAAPELEAQTADQQQQQQKQQQTTATSQSSSQSSTKPQTQEPTPTSRPKTLERTYSKPSYITYPTTPRFYPDSIPHQRKTITPSPQPDIQSANALHPNFSNGPPKYTTRNTGAGRLITFDTPQPLSKLITRIAAATNYPKGFQIAIPQGLNIEDMNKIRTVGVCPGSGASVLSKATPDLYLTGEMSHHEALAIIERGGCVICLSHSNTERGYLNAVMQGLLETEIGSEWTHIRQQPSQAEAVRNGWSEILADESVKVVVSERDRDPFGIVVLEESAVVGEKI